MPTTQEISDYVTSLASATLAGTEEVYLATDEKTTVQDIANLTASSDGVQTIDLGLWDMDTDASKTYSHSMGNFGFLKNANVMVRDDATTKFIPIEKGGYFEITNTQVIVYRDAAGFFDSTDYDDAVTISRGRIRLEYFIP